MDDVKAKSEIARKNRMSQRNGPRTRIVKHKGGSRSAVATAAELRRDDVPTHKIGYAVFKTFHGSYGVYSDSKSAPIDTEAQRHRAQVLESLSLSGEAGEPEPIQVSMDAIVDKKKRIFGQVSRSCSSTYSSTGSSQIDADAISKLVEERVAERVAEMKKARGDDEQKAMRDRITSLEATVEAMIGLQKNQTWLLEQLVRSHCISSDRGPS